jgi:hypothetical protein
VSFALSGVRASRVGKKDDGETGGKVDGSRGEIRMGSISCNEVRFNDVQWLGARQKCSRRKGGSIYSPKNEGFPNSVNTVVGP